MVRLFHSAKPHCCHLWMSFKLKIFRLFSEDWVNPVCWKLPKSIFFHSPPEFVVIFSFISSESWSVQGVTYTIVNGSCACNHLCATLTIHPNCSIVLLWYNARKNKDDDILGVVAVNWNTILGPVLKWTLCRTRDQFRIRA